MGLVRTWLGTNIKGKVAQMPPSPTLGSALAGFEKDCAMPDAAPLILPPVLAVQEESQVHPAKRKKDRRHLGTAVVIGAILLMADGSKCQIVGYDRNGRPICLPLQE